VSGWLGQRGRYNNGDGTREVVTGQAWVWEDRNEQKGKMKQAQRWVFQKGGVYKLVKVQEKVANEAIEEP